MPAGDAFKDHVLELLSPIGDVTSRAMFGGFGIFHQGDMFALISKSTLYFKVNDHSRARYESAGSRQFKPMPYYEVPAAVFEDTPLLLDWARTAVAIARASVEQKNRRSKIGD